MAITDKALRELITRVDGLSERVTTLETLVKVGGSVWTLIVLVWLGWLSVSLHGLSGDVRAVKQKLDDKGLGAIVSQLSAPKSPEQFQAALGTAVAQVRAERADGKKPDVRKVNVLATAVAEATQQQPDSPEVWQAAGRLAAAKVQTLAPAHLSAAVTEKVGQPMPSTGNCLSPDMPSTFGPPPLGKTVEVDLLMHDCTLALDDIADLRASQAKNAEMFHVLYGDRDLKYKLLLVRVHITYAGGPVIPFSSIQALNCTYDLELFRVPPAPAATIVRALLTNQTDVNALFINAPAVS